MLLVCGNTAYSKKVSSLQYLLAWSLLIGLGALILNCSFHLSSSAALAGNADGQPSFFSKASTLALFPMERHVEGDCTTPKIPRRPDKEAIPGNSLNMELLKQSEWECIPCFQIQAFFGRVIHLINWESCHWRSYRNFHCVSYSITASLLPHLLFPKQ